MLLAGVFRLSALGAAPHGLYHDEAFNGIDALGVLNGDRPVYFAANHGREPIYIYLVSIAVSLFGRTPFAVRLPAALIGVLTIAAIYWMARELWGRRVGLLAAAIMAISVWPVHLSRIGFRAVLLPLVVAIGIALSVRAWRSGTRRDWLFAGACWGIALYTYLAVRFVPLVFVLFIGFLLLFRRIEAGPFLPQRLTNGVLWTTVGVAALSLPLLVFTLGNWDTVMGRPGGVSIFEPGINQGDWPGTLIRHTLNALGMFFVQGDGIARHNVPYRPVFDPLLAIAFLIGLVVVIRQTRRRIAAVFVLIWIGVMLLPTILAEDAPHFLRAVGVLPLAMIFPALGLDWIADRIGRWNHAVAIGALIGVLGLSTIFSVRDYVPYATSVETGYAFEAGAVELANAINRAAEQGQRVVVDDVYWQEWTAIPFMVDRARLDANVAIDVPFLLIVWPYQDWTSRLDAWPNPIQISVRAGPPVQGDRDTEAYTMAALIGIESVPTTNIVEADFASGIHLLGHTIEDRGEAWQLRTLWRTDLAIEDGVTMFVHLLDSGTLAGSADGDAGDGLYPMRLWRVGDVIVDERSIPLPNDRDQLALEIGLYDRVNNTRLTVIGSSAAAIDDAVQLDAPRGPGP